MPISQREVRRYVLTQWIPAGVTVLMASAFVIAVLVSSTNYYRRLAHGEKRVALTQIVRATEFRSKSASGYYLLVRINGRSVYQRASFPMPKGQAVRVEYTVMRDGEYALTRLEPVDQASAAAP